MVHAPLRLAYTGPSPGRFHPAIPPEYLRQNAGRVVKLARFPSGEISVRTRTEQPLDRSRAR